MASYTNQLSNKFILDSIRVDIDDASAFPDLYPDLALYCDNEHGTERNRDIRLYEANLAYLVITVGIHLYIP